MVSSFSSSDRMKKTKDKNREKEVLFCWKFCTSADGEKMSEQPVVEIVLYSPNTLYDDRFTKLRNKQPVENLTIIPLTKSENWIFTCDQDGEVHQEKSAYMMFNGKLSLAKGNYIYLYRVNGKLRHNPNEPTTFLNSKRRVNYIKSSIWDTVEKEADLNQVIDLPVLSPDPRADVVARTPIPVNTMRACLSVREMYRERMSDGMPMTLLERHFWQRTFERMSGRMQMN